MVVNNAAICTKVIETYAVTRTFLGVSIVVGIEQRTVRKILINAGLVDPSAIRRGPPKGQPKPNSRRRQIFEAVQACGSQAEVARAFNISRQAVHEAVRHHREYLAQEATRGAPSPPPGTPPVR